MFFLFLAGMRMACVEFSGCWGFNYWISFFQLLMAAIGKRLPEQKLKIKYTAKKVEAEAVAPSRKQKRGAPEITNAKVKRLKMDRGMTVQCASILKKLMSHPDGWVFNQPVDPVALNIPDYFSIISNPMDLGTIKSKLEKNLYSATEDFAEDIRLTFSNAMLYNPQSNNVHYMAKQLNENFNIYWKKVARSDSLKVDQGKFSSGGGTIISNENSMKKCSAATFNAGSMEGTKKLRKVSRGKRLPTLSSSLKGHALICQSDEMVRVKSDKLEKGTSFELRRLMKISCHARVKQGEYARATQYFRTKSSGEDLQKGTDRSNAHACGYVDTKSSLSIQNDSNKGSSSEELCTERSLVKDSHVRHSEASALHCQVKNTISCIGKSDPDSDGAVSAVGDDNICTRSHPMTPTTAAAPSEGWIIPMVDVQVQPSTGKALHAAKLKYRFVDTILKAQQKILLENVDKDDRFEIQRKKERLEKKQREEKGRLEAELRAAEVASGKKAENESKLPREKEREAARIALQKMEKTVYFEDNNIQIVKELEKLSGCVLTYYGYFCLRNSIKSWGTRGFEYPLERLGLFIKDDYDVFVDKVEDMNGDVEEGEILQ